MIDFCPEPGKIETPKCVDLGSKSAINSFEAGYQFRQRIEHPELHIRNTYLNILITSKFFHIVKVSSCMSSLSHPIKIATMWDFA